MKNLLLFGLIAIAIASCKKEQPMTCNNSPGAGGSPTAQNYILMDSDTISTNPDDVEVVLDENTGELFVNILYDWIQGTATMQLSVSIDYDNYSGVGTYQLSDAVSTFVEFNDDVTTHTPNLAQPNLVTVTSYDSVSDDASGSMVFNFSDGTEFLISY